MATVEGIISAYQRLLPGWKFSEASDWLEGFAIRRFLKKMEVPDKDREDERREACFNDYIAFDQCLSRPPGFLPRKWYLARQTIHSVVRNFRLAEATFTSGSEVRPTKGLNSLESKLSRSTWHCTPGCFEMWARTAYSTLAIKRAVRKRFAKAVSHDRNRIRDFDKESWELYRGRREAAFLCFRRKLARVTHVYQASRFSSVRKNNEKNRPIAVEGLCNMLVQRRIGNGLRTLLRKRFGVDLNSLAAKHRRLIRDASVATIDLSNASDSVSCWLIDFLFPKRFLGMLYASRAPFLEGPDGHYHVLNKVSSMGCGFTFELMTLVLLALGLEHDKAFSVFGDDIIVSNAAASGLIEDLEAVGFVVNEEKSFVDSEFRESCGANWHDRYGYVRSFDFWYPMTIHDCIVVYNKASLLGELYPQFKALATALARPVPLALQGPRDVCWEQLTSDGARGRETDVLLSGFFKTGVNPAKKGLKVDDSSFSGVLEGYQLVPKGQRLQKRYFYGFKWTPKTASRRRDTLVMKHHYAKYAAYLHGGRMTDDGITGRGAWQRVTWVQCGQIAYRVKALATLHDSLPATATPRGDEPGVSHSVNSE